jgi:hypothetical protein
MSDSVSVLVSSHFPKLIWRSDIGILQIQYQGKGCKKPRAQNLGKGWKRRPVAFERESASRLCRSDDFLSGHAQTDEMIAFDARFGRTVKRAEKGLPTKSRFIGVKCSRFQKLRVYQDLWLCIPPRITFSAPLSRCVTEAGFLCIQLTLW